MSLRRFTPCSLYRYGSSILPMNDDISVYCVRLACWEPRGDRSRDKGSKVDIGSLPDMLNSNTQDNWTSPLGPHNTAHGHPVYTRRMACQARPAATVSEWSFHWRQVSRPVSASTCGASFIEKEGARHGERLIRRECHDVGLLEACVASLDRRWLLPLSGHAQPDVCSIDAQTTHHAC